MEGTNSYRIAATLKGSRICNLIISNIVLKLMILFRSFLFGDHRSEILLNRNEWMRERYRVFMCVYERERQTDTEKK